jgi:putative addiction module killer protein
MTPKQLVFYQTQKGDEPFNDWLGDLDNSFRPRIQLRLDRVRLGNYGDYQGVGEGVYELRFFFGAGYRVYFAEEGNTVVLLLCGGDKSSQSKDIAKAQAYWKDYQAVKEKSAKEKANQQNKEEQ